MQESASPSESSTTEASSKPSETSAAPEPSEEASPKEEESASATQSDPSQAESSDALGYGEAEVPPNVDRTPFTEKELRTASNLVAESMRHQLSGKFKKACNVFALIDSETGEYGSVEEVGELELCLSILEASQGIYDQADQEMRESMSDPKEYSARNEEPGYAITYSRYNELYPAVKLKDGRILLALQK